ncbi:AEC family transporter [Halalkalibacter okhensis]|uniref:Malonate transporter n=1 Tax=Halalkalibacter okhensis TaxID=333138 RepID=A0A0B0IGI3_9BACI|nr:AEC family transporter [Halalkalibacter okhensis]KHF41713.1 malonate transporter [Halalkalibacter okhensis]
MNQEFLYIILIIGLGYLLKRFNILQERDGEVISKIIFKITLPALVIVTFHSVEIDTTLIYLPFIVFIFGLITVILCLWVFKKEERELKGSFLMLSGFNVGLFAFPLVYAIWGMEGLTHFSMFDVGTSFIVFGLAYIFGSYFSKEGLHLKPLDILKKLGKSIPLMTYIIASTLNFNNIQLPDTFIHVASTISAANIPLSLLLLGLYLNFKVEKQFIKPILKYLTFRYSLGLLVGVAMYFYLPYDQMFRYTIMVGLLLPVAASALVFAVEFKYSTTRLVATISNITIVISMVILYVFANFII